MTMNPMISVIIPVYNVEKYINTCLESVRQQTYKNFEVIIVNDGSTDQSSKIIDDYLKKYDLNNYILLNKENGGLCSARNCGLTHASGEWIFFLDSDDWLENNALSTLVECLEQNPSDLVFGGIRAVNEKTGESEVWDHYPKSVGWIPGEWDGLHSFEYCWGRLYRKTVIDKYNMRFDTRILYAEDNAWQLDYVSKIQSYSCTKAVIYNYRINRSGSMTSKLVYPTMKYYNWEHLLSFIHSYKEEEITDALKTNYTFTRVVWSILIAAVSSKIIEGDYNAAHAIKKLPFARKAVREYVPRTRKDKIYRTIWILSFQVLCLMVRIYYKNFTKFRNSALIQKIS